MGPGSALLAIAADLLPKMLPLKGGLRDELAIGRLVTSNELSAISATSVSASDRPPRLSFGSGVRLEVGIFKSLLFF